MNSTQNNLKLSTKKEVSHYKRISDSLRQELIEMVFLKDYLLKDAAEFLSINYSTAKTILRIFRTERRLKKKRKTNAKAQQEFVEIKEEYARKRKLVVKHVNHFSLQNDAKNRNDCSSKTTSDKSNMPNIGISDFGVYVNIFNKFKNFNNNIQQEYDKLISNEMNINVLLFLIEENAFALNPQGYNNVDN
jgi:hypothetical protein